MNAANRYPVVLAALIVALSVTSATVAAIGWRDKVASSLLELVDQRTQEERSVLVMLDLQAAGVPEPASSSYPAASHEVRLALESAGRWGELTAWLRGEPSLALKATTQSFWERGAAYLHQWRGVLGSLSVSDFPSVAALPFVSRILDASATFPLALPPAAESGPETALQTLSGLLSTQAVTSGDLRACVARCGWIAVDRTAATSLLSAPERPPLLSGDAPLSSSMYAATAVAVRAPEGATSAGLDLALAAPTAGTAWKGSLDESDLYALVDALLLTGGEVITAARVPSGGQEIPVYVFWRPVDAAAMAALGGTGPAAAYLPGPPAPGVVSATKGSHEDHVTVTWDPVPGAQAYEILSSANADGVYDLTAIREENGFEDFRVSQCAARWYRVRPVGSQGPGAASASLSGFIGLVPPRVPATWASDGTAAQGIRVEWTPVPEATHYVVNRTEYMTGSTSRLAKLYFVGTTAETSLVDSDVVIGQTYLYRVRAMNPCGGGELGDPDVGSALAVAPSGEGAAPPSWVEATRGKPYDRIQLNWVRVPGAVEYRILRASDYAGPYEAVATTSSAYWEDTEVLVCENYWYRVITVDKMGAGAPSATAHGSCGDKPASPERVKATRGIHTDAIALQWAPVPMAATYQVARAPARDGPFGVIATTEDLSYVDVGLEPCQTFWYKIRATNLCGTSGYSAIVEGSTFCK